MLTVKTERHQPVIVWHIHGHCVVSSDVTLSTLFQPELYLCTPVKVDYTQSYYISE